MTDQDNVNVDRNSSVTLREVTKENLCSGCLYGRSSEKGKVRTFACAARGFFENYICSDCGYFETYITDKDALSSIPKRAEKMEDWKKVK